MKQEPVMWSIRFQGLDGQPYQWLAADRDGADKDADYLREQGLGAVEVLPVY